MTDTQIQDNEPTFGRDEDAAFEAEREAARQEQDHPIDDEPEQQEEVQQQADPERERLEKLARDKDGMARSERQKRREAEDRARALEERLAALEGKQSDTIDFSAIPSVDQDPIANIEAIRKLAEQMQGQQKKQGEQTAQQRQMQDIQTRVASYEQDFRADHADYDQAVTFMIEAHKSDLEERGLSGDDLMKALQNDLMGIALQAMSAHKDPAEVTYNLAKKRGFAKQETPVVDKKDDKLQAIERGQKTSRSLSTAGSRTGDGELTIEAVNKLDGAAFDAALAKLKSQNRGAAPGWR